MRGYRFMLCRRWVLFAVAVALATYACYWLGLWQWHRLESRKADNAIVRTNEAQTPASPAAVMASPGQGLDPDRQWRQVTATGTYDTAQTVIVRYREDSEGNPGVELVVPMRLTDGSTLLVDRGFYRTDDTPSSTADVPAPPTGQVTITGYARVDGTGSSTEVSDQSTRAISSAAISRALDTPMYGGFVQAFTETPAAATPLPHGSRPALNDGPHFFYALQWWFFGLLAVFGFGYLAYDERHHGPRGERPHRVQRPVKVRQTNVPAAYQRPRRGDMAQPAETADTEETAVSASKN